MKPPLVPKPVAERSVVPSGFRMEIFAEEQQEVPIVTSESLRLTRRPAEAVEEEGGVLSGRRRLDTGRRPTGNDR